MLRGTVGNLLSLKKSDMCPGNHGWGWQGERTFSKSEGKPSCIESMGAVPDSTGRAELVRLMGHSQRQLFEIRKPNPRRLA